MMLPHGGYKIHQVLQAHEYYEHRAPYGDQGVQILEEHDIMHSTDKASCSVPPVIYGTRCLLIRAREIQLTLADLGARQVTYTSRIPHH